MEHIRRILLFLVAVCIAIPFTVGSPSIDVSTRTLALEINDEKVIYFHLDEPVPSEVDIDFVTDFDNIVYINPNSTIITDNSTEKVNISVLALNAGHVTISVNASSSSPISTKNAIVHISIYKHYYLDVISNVVGWLYFVAWSVSFYPQTYINFKRKSVVGLNFDFVGLNITGFLAYSFFNLGLYFSSEVQEEYLIGNPKGIIPVERNDVVFGLHAAFATTIQIIQCFIYERGNQKVSLIAKILLALIWTTGLIFLIITVTGVNTYLPWLTFLYYFSYAKLSITLIKYIPQVYFNYVRKSTEGWSIGNILLDCTGGSLSILQMFFNAYNYDDFQSIFGNFTKFGLGLISILFDIIFMVQHYCIYGRNRKQSLINQEDLSNS